MTNDWMDEGAIQLSAAIASGEIRAVDSLAASLKRAEDQAHLGAIHSLNPDMAFAAAERIDDARAKGNLDLTTFSGVPLLMKNLGPQVEGLPTTWGSKAIARRGSPALQDDHLTARFRAAGFVILGMTSVPEFGMTFTCEPPNGPIARNPLNESLTPGGSSGGAAAAVAAGIVPLAHANDAVGSIRIPAACCGLVGLKPSKGAMPSGPDFNNYNGGIVGDFVITRTLEDAAAALDALAGRTRGPQAQPAIGPALKYLEKPVPLLRIGFVQELPAGLAFDGRRRDAILHAAQVLRRAGHTLVPVEPSTFTVISELSGLAAGRILSANLARQIGTLVPSLEQDELELLTRAALQYGRSLTGIDLMEADIAIGRASGLLADVFDEIDLILTPMLSGPPPHIGTFPTDHEDLDLHGRRSFALAPYASFANVTGAPALTIPHGRDLDGLPLPIQLLGPIGSDVLLLRLANLLRIVEPWGFGARIAGFL